MDENRFEVVPEDGAYSVYELAPDGQRIDELPPLATAHTEGDALLLAVMLLASYRLQTRLLDRVLAAALSLPLPEIGT